jgi:hypothetical protein
MGAACPEMRSVLNPGSRGPVDKLSVAQPVRFEPRHKPALRLSPGRLVPTGERPGFPRRNHGVRCRFGQVEGRSPLQFPDQRQGVDAKSQTTGLMLINPRSRFGGKLRTIINPPNPNVGIQNDHAIASHSSGLTTGSKGFS